MVVNWAEEAEDASLFDSSFLDEHLLERVSALEETGGASELKRVKALLHAHPKFFE